jgi:ADP-ribose pyrophosphatase
LLFVEQYRVPCEARVIELPAGIVGDEPGKSGETLEAAATRELIEETGYEAGAIEILSSGPPSAGLASEQVTLVRARNLRRTGPGGGDAGEEIQVWEIPLTTAEEWLRQRAAQGVLIDPKVFAGLYFASR